MVDRQYLGTHPNPIVNFYAWEPENAILHTDTYKHSHYKMYEEGTEELLIYLEARAWKFRENMPVGKIAYIGPQYVLDRHFAGVRVTMEMVEEAKRIMDIHLPGVFNYEGWRYIAEECGGKLNLEIKSLPEGTMTNPHTALSTIRTTDKKLFWLAGHIEPHWLRLWYPMAIATYSRECKKLIQHFLENTGGPLEASEYMLWDFGYRGTSSHETACIGGMAHLTNGSGTDNIAGFLQAMNTYGLQLKDIPVGVPAAEHAPVTGYGQKGEFNAFRQIMKQFPTGFLSIISDSYNIFNAVDNGWAGELKPLVMERAGKLVVRPDSLDPVMVNRHILHSLWNAYGGTYTTGRDGKQYKVLDQHIGIIQGDGIDYAMLDKIMTMCQEEGFAVHNFVFGSGGGLLQKHDRDELSVAIKNCYMVVNGEGRAVYKDPIGASSKKSYRGQPRVVKDEFGELVTIAELERVEGGEDLMETVFLNGQITKRVTFDEIRERVKITQEERDALRFHREVQAIERNTIRAARNEELDLIKGLRGILGTTGAAQVLEKLIEREEQEIAAI